MIDLPAYHDAERTEPKARRVKVCKSCGVSWARHARCVACTGLVGEGHTLGVAVNGMCAWCQADAGREKGRVA